MKGGGRLQVPKPKALHHHTMCDSLPAMADRQCNFIYCNRWFSKFAAKEGIAANALIDAVRRAENGLIDADLGGGLIKQRIARPGSGRSGGYRSILIFRSGERAIFVFGFAKNDRANLTNAELKIYRKAASLRV